MRVHGWQRISQHKEALYCTCSTVQTAGLDQWLLSVLLLHERWVVTCHQASCLICCCCCFLVSVSSGLQSYSVLSEANSALRTRAMKMYKAREREGKARDGEETQEDCGSMKLCVCSSAKAKEQL